MSNYCGVFTNNNETKWRYVVEKYEYVLYTNTKIKWNRNRVRIPETIGVLKYTSEYMCVKMFNIKGYQ